ncbi:hypothetical protein [Acidilobus sp.]|uniref:hypothetical protein n=1 Tax=Acidilobus sp. TaxID=1872109 RepID=UPI003D03D1D1
MGESITSNIIIERLITMAQGVEDTSSHMLEVLSSPSFSPELIEKTYRQDLLRFREVVTKGKEGLLDYIANGRLSLIAYKEFYIEAALQVECIMNRLEAGTYRLLLSLSLERNLPESLVESVRGLLRELQGSSIALVDMLRANEGPVKDPAARRKLLDDKFDLVSEAEKRADAIYREALAMVAEKYSNEAAKLLMLKEVIDSFEGAVDCAYNASTYVRLVGLGLLS